MINLPEKLFAKPLHKKRSQKLQTVSEMPNDRLNTGKYRYILYHTWDIFTLLKMLQLFAHLAAPLWPGGVCGGYGTLIAC